MKIPMVLARNKGGEISENSKIHSILNLAQYDVYDSL